MQWRIMQNKHFWHCGLLLSQCGFKLTQTDQTGDFYLETNTAACLAQNYNSYQQAVIKLYVGIHVHLTFIQDLHKTRDSLVTFLSLSLSLSHTHTHTHTSTHTSTHTNTHTHTHTQSHTHTHTHTHVLSLSVCLSPCTLLSVKCSQGIHTFSGSTPMSSQNFSIPSGSIQVPSLSARSINKRHHLSKLIFSCKNKTKRNIKNYNKMSILKKRAIYSKKRQYKTRGKNKRKKEETKECRKICIWKLNWCLIKSSSHHSSRCWSVSGPILMHSHTFLWTVVSQHAVIPSNGVNTQSWQCQCSNF